MTENINKTYRHQYHLMASKGWLNDPNGLSIYNNSYHLFFQYNPVSTLWGPMHWGHAVSTDLYQWKHLPIALYPDMSYDCSGVFSGGAIVKDGIHHLYYTGHQDYQLNKQYDIVTALPSQANNTIVSQVQCVALSSDGVVYKKHSNNPILTKKDIPQDILQSDFRDPNVWKHMETYYMIVGAKTKEETGLVLFFTSKDGLSWTYKNRYVMPSFCGTVWECPNLISFKNQDYLIVSPQHIKQNHHHFQNVHSVIAIKGHFDYEQITFIEDSSQELDKGFDFYAPQTVLDTNGDTILIAWMNMWDRTYPLHELGHGWNGAMTLPRIIEHKNGRLHQTAHPNINKYMSSKHTWDTFSIHNRFTSPYLNGTSQVINASIKIERGTLAVHLFENENERFILHFDPTNQVITIDRSNTLMPIDSTTKTKDFYRSSAHDFQEVLNIEIYQDVSSVEVFIDDGILVFTSLFYTLDPANKVSLHADGVTHIKTLQAYDIVIPERKE